MTDHAYRGNWPRIRAAILERDRHVCQIRGGTCTTRATHVDHIITVEQGGGNDERNLRAACATCNIARGNRERHNKPSRRW